MIRWMVAANASPMTLDGTRTYIVGRERVAVIDPGPDDPRHLYAIASAVDGAPAEVLLTHLHSDHADGAATLASELRCPIRALAYGNLADGDEVDTDAGALTAVATAGHTADHVSFHCPEHEAVFCGDLLMGGLDTALVALPEGNLTDYLASLERLRGLRPRVIYPAHGPPFENPDEAIARYVRHRMDRQAQVLSALGDAALDEHALVDAVYGATLHAELRNAALGAVRAYLHHLSSVGRVRVDANGRWSRSDAVAQG